MSEIRKIVAKALEEAVARKNMGEPSLDKVRVAVETSPADFTTHFKSVLKTGFRQDDRYIWHVSAERLLSIMQQEIKFNEIKDTDIQLSTSNLIPTFSLSDTDSKRVFELCAQMRKIVFATPDFDEPHRLRLLNRIAAIEAEVKKPKGMFDVVRAGVSDVGETLGKFGKDIKPLTDRIKEVTSIARKNTGEYDQLPEPEELKRLPAPDEEPSEE